MTRPMDVTQTNHHAHSNPHNAYDPPSNNNLHNDSSALLNYVYEKQRAPNGTKRHQMSHPAQKADPREAGIGASPPIVNPYQPIPPVRTNSDLNGANFLLPSPQVRQPQPPQSRPHSGYQNPGTASQVERNVDHPAKPLIDTLPWKKQKQIYQIVGGISSGLRNVREQTDILQRQLDSLSAALGIDEDDES